MGKKKVLLLLMTAALVGAAVTGCGKDTSDKESGNKSSTEQGEKTTIQIPECEEMDEDLQAEFVEANTIENLCEKYGSIEIDSSFVYMDDNGKKSNGGKNVQQYIKGENGIVSQNVSDGYSSYQEGNKVSYSKYNMDIAGEDGTEDVEGQSGVSYMVNYTSDAYFDIYGDDVFGGIYTGVEYAMQSGYKETKDGYEIYEAYDFGDGTGNVITYYANKDKIVEKSVSVTYPEKAARYEDSVNELKTGVDVSIKPIQEFENGQYTVTIVEKANGTQTQIKVPAGTELYFGVGQDEIVTRDEAGTEMVNSDRYDTSVTVNEDVTLYIVESAADAEEDEPSVG